MTARHGMSSGKTNKNHFLRMQSLRRKNLRNRKK